MPIEPVDIKDFLKGKELRDRFYEEWESKRNVKRCQCGTPYSYDPAYEKDPRCCASCGRREGEIVG